MIRGIGKYGLLSSNTPSLLEPYFQCGRLELGYASPTVLNKVINFSCAMNNVPEIVITPITASGYIVPNVHICLISITLTGFTARIHDTTQTFTTAHKCICCWHASCLNHL